MARLAVLSNAASRGNARGRWAVWRAAAPDVVQVVTHHVDELDAAIDTLLAADADALVVDGGDGTLQTLLTHCLRRDLLTRLPPLVVMPGGTTNMGAQDLSGAARFGAALRAALALRALPVERWSLHERPIVLVETADASRYAGLFFGLGDLVRGVEAWQASLRHGLMAGTVGVGTAVARTAWGIARRRAPFDRATDVRLRFDDGPAAELALSALMVTTLERLVLGMRPSWGDTHGALLCTSLAARPPRLLRTLPLALWGAGARLRPDDGYACTRAERLVLELHEGWLLDGEVLAAPAPLTLSASAPLRFVRLHDERAAWWGRDGVRR